MKKLTERLSDFGSEIINPAISNLAGIITEEITSKVLYTVNVSAVFDNIDRIIPKYFPKLKQRVKLTKMHFNKAEDIKCEILPIRNLERAEHSTDFCRYKGVLICLNAAHQDNDDSHTEYTMSVVRTKKNIKILKSFIQRLIRENTKMYKPEVYSCMEFNYAEYKGFTKDIIHKTFNDIFLPQAQLDELINAINSFRDKHDWYIKNKIPYHFGILLYGPPGTGKSSIAQAIISHLNSQTFLIPGDKIMELPQKMTQRELPILYSQLRTVLVEDVDCGLFSSNLSILSKLNSDDNDDDDDTTKRNHGLAGVLNAIDGLGAPEGCIYIFTTNHIEKLDEAFIRPGRIDIKLEINYVNEETFAQFLKRFYGNDTLPANFKIKDGITCAYLQVEVMKGISRENLISLVSI